MLDASAALDRIFQALADPSRRAIVERLTRGRASVSEVAQPLAMTLAAVVQHVQSLEASGLIRTRKEGRVRHCEIVPEVLARAEGWLTQRRTLWERNLDRLGEVLAAQEAHERASRERAAPAAKRPVAAKAASARKRSSR